MKIKIFIIQIFFFCFYSFAQETEWETYDFDNIVSVKMPYTVYEIDTIINNNKLLYLYSENDKSSFKVSKMFIGKIYSNIETLKLPTDEKSLNSFYKNSMNVIDEMIENQFKFDTRKKIKKGDLIGYQLNYKNEKGLQAFIISLFYVNKEFYAFTYQNKDGINKKDKDIFFKSIYFDEEKELIQYERLSTQKIIFISLIVLFILSYILRYKKNKNRNN